MSRLFGVMLIYLTRPLCWVLFVIVVTALVVGWSFRSDEYVNYAPGGVAEAVSKFLDYRQRVDSLETLNAVLENQDTQAVAVHYGSLARDLEYGNVNLDDAGDRSQEIIPKDKVAERLEKLELPRLTQSLSTGVWQVRQTTIEQLGNVGSLEHIDFLIPASNKVSLDLSSFSKLLNLKTLNLGQLITIESLTPLQALPKLETLTIGKHQFVTAKHLREIAAIKSLRQLFLPDVTNNPAAMEALSELKSSSLERVYISIPPSETAKLQAISSAIPSLRVRSSKYLLMRCLGCGVVMWMILMINVLGIHFSSLFTLPAAVLTPGYQVTQRRFAWTVMLGLVLLGAGVMWSCKVNLGLAVFLSAAALFHSVSLSSSLQTRNTSALSAERWSGFLILVGILFIVGWAVQDLLGTDYLLARPPWWLVGLLAIVAIFSAVRWDRMLHSVCRKRFASGNEPILSFFDMQEAALNLNVQRLGNQVEPFERVRNWMVGAGLILLLVIVAQRYSPEFWLTPMIDRFLRTYVPMFAIWALMLILIKWWQRLPFLATMIPRPPGRKLQVNKVFKGVAFDYLRAGPLLLAATISISRGNDIVESSIWTSFLILLLVIGIVGICYALTLAVITVRSAVWIVAICFLVTLTIGLFSGVVVYIGIAGGSWVLESGLFSVVLLALAAVATVLVRRQYQQIEWGSFLS